MLLSNSAIPKSFESIVGALRRIPFCNSCCKSLVWVPWDLNTPSSEPIALIKWLFDPAIFSASELPSSPVKAYVRSFMILSILSSITLSRSCSASPKLKSLHASFALFAPDPISLNNCLSPVLAPSIPMSTKSDPRSAAETFNSAILILN